MNTSPPSISESEWLVAEVVWNHPDLTAAEIAARLPATAKWKLKTVNTFLARLVAKGVLRPARDGRAYRYHARIPREQCVRSEGDSFLRRVFGGAVAPMLAHFCEVADLSEQEIADLRRILNKKSSRESSPGKNPR